MESTGETNTPSVPEFAKWLESEHPRLFLYFLTVLAFNEHLGRFLPTSPIRTEDPITSDVCRLIHQRYPQLDTLAIIDFRIALQKHLHESGAIQAHLDYTPPPRR
jgi:hypothetical protein